MVRGPRESRGVMGWGWGREGSGRRSPRKWEGLEIGSACSSISREREGRGSGEMVKMGLVGGKSSIEGDPQAELDKKDFGKGGAHRAVKGGRVDGAAE